MEDGTWNEISGTYGLTRREIRFRCFIRQTSPMVLASLSLVMGIILAARNISTSVKLHHRTRASSPWKQTHLQDSSFHHFG